MTNLKAIIFDFDGVIAESMDIKEKAFLFVFQKYPEHAEKIVALHRRHGGMSRFEKFRIIYRDFLKIPYDEKIGEELSQKFSQYIRKEMIKCPYVKGAKEFLKKYHGKLSLFIASGTPQEEIRSIAKARDIDKYFLGIFGAPASKAEICKKILEKYNFMPQQVLMVGDSIDDYRGAKEAGIDFIGRITEKNPFLGTKIEAAIYNLAELAKNI